MKSLVSRRRYGLLGWALCACLAAVSVDAMTLAEREKMELKSARRPAPAAVSAVTPIDAANDKPVVGSKPKPKSVPVDLHGLSAVPDRFLQPLQGKSCGCEAYADNSSKKDLIFLSDGQQGIIYRKNLPYFLPHLLHSSLDGANSNLYGSTDLRVRTTSQRASPAVCSSYRAVPENGSCADGTIDVVIDNRNQKPIKAVFVCGC